MPRIRDTTLFHDANLVSLWEFEGNFLDTAPAGNGNTGVGSLTITSSGNGKFGQGVGFSQPSPSKVTVTSPANLAFSGDFTYNIWIKPASGQPDPYAHAIENLCSILYLITDGGAANNGWGFQNSSPAVFTTNTVDFDAWQMVSIRRTGTSLDILKNGVVLSKVQNDAISGTIGGGNLYFGSQSGTGRYITAAMDDISAFSRALSDAELVSLAAVPGTTTSTSTSSSSSTTTTSTSTTTTSTSSSTTTTSTSTTTTSTSTTTTSTSTSMTTTSISTSTTSSTSTSTTMPMNLFVENAGE